MATQTVRFFNPNPIKFRSLNRRYFAYSYRGTDEGFQSGGAITQIVLSNGSLSVDGLTIPNPKFGTRSVAWSQESGGKFCSGRLFFDRNGIELHGIVSLGETAETAVHTDLFASAVPPTKYQTQITKSRQAAGVAQSSVPANQWSGGLELDLGYSYKLGDSLPSLKVSLGQQDFTPYVALAVTSDDLLQLTLTANNASSVICDFDGSLYLSGTITFSTFGDTFMGTISATCGDQSGSGNYLWKGTATNNAVLAQPRRDLAAAAVAAAAPTGLSLGDLIAQAPDDSVGQTANAMLVENMKWAMAQSSTESDWLKQFFGQSAPVLPDKRISAIKKDLAWYQNQFAPAYLTWGLATLTGPMAPSVTLNPTQKQTLQDYLQKGMGQSTSYARQMQPLFTQAYESAKPRIQLYIKDKGSNWAQQLFDFVTSPAQLILLVNRAFATHDVNASNHFAEMLTTLDPSGALAKEYQMRFLNRMLLQASMNSVVLDHDSATAWMPQVIQKFIETNQPRPRLAADAGDQDTDAQEVADALQQWAGSLGGFGNAATAIITILIEAKGSSVAEQSQKASDAFVEKFPKYAKAANFLFFAAWAGGIFQVLVTFIDKRPLTPTDIALGVNSCVDFVNRAVGGVADFFSGKFTLPKSYALNSAMSQEVELQTFRDSAESLSGSDEESFIFDGPERTVYNTFQNGEVVTAGTTWEKFLTTAPKVVAVIGLVTTAVCAIIATIMFADDVKSGQPVSQQALDGITMAASWGQAICLALGLFFFETFFAIAASIFAIIGIIVAIIELFKPAPPANEPVNDFMENTGIPFVNGLQPQVAIA